MRQAEKIWEYWDQGSFIGDRKSHCRVTVEPDWHLRKTAANYANSKRGPFRWFQDVTNDQEEIEIPYVKNISIDRSIDTDIASCTITIYNQQMSLNTQASELPTQLGNPGYFTWNHGRSAESAARWNQTVNSWSDVLIPNALIRTYQGYGGFLEDGTPMAIDDAVEDGYLMLTGVWLVDDVTMGSNAMLTMKCRDMGKLLAVQQYFSPLVPAKEYLVPWQRWVWKHFDAKFNPRKPHITTSQTSSTKPAALTYQTSGGDMWYGQFNTVIHGHKGTDSLDGNLDTFALSVGNYNPQALYCTDWFQYLFNADLTEVYVHPWAGNYQMYISVKENGYWVDGGQGTIPYDPAELYATQAVVDTGAAIPFVLMTGVPWEEGRWYKLPRSFKAQEIRITFRNHVLSEWGPWFYRAGIREIRANASTTTVSSVNLTTVPASVPFVYGIANYDDPTVPFESGYWCVVDDGQVIPFGDAREHAKVDPYPIDDLVLAIRPTNSGKGYFTMQKNGVVHAYGDAVHYGDYWHNVAQGSQEFIDMAVTKSGLGYWLLKRDGTVWPFGDATWFGNSTPTGSLGPQGYAGTGIESHPTLDGYWILDGNGEVQAFGDLPNYEGVTPLRSGMLSNEWCRAIRRNKDGDGYWILTGAGNVWAKGSATSFGQVQWPKRFSDNLMDDYLQLTYDIAPTSNDDGYLIVQANGHIEVKGNARHFGEPGQQGVVRSPGNYSDYSQIICYLLAWAGFTYYTPEIASEGLTDGSDLFPNTPPVFGSIETTGAYADEDLGLDLFDKKTIMECIHTLKEIVGFSVYVRDDGGFVFRSPNLWSIGNFWEDGTPTDFIPEIDEKTVLTDYSVSFSDESNRSEIIIATEDPTQGNKTTTTTRIIPATAALLKGIEKPAMWINAAFVKKSEAKIMAELIALHIWFGQRIGNVTCAANPNIQIDDQVRIFERVTSESYIHYCRGVSTQHDLDTGIYTMTLTTHWLGDEDNWVITRDKIPTGQELNRLQISESLLQWMEKSDSRAIRTALLNDFGAEVDSTIISARVPTVPGADAGQAAG